MDSSLIIKTGGKSLSYLCVRQSRERGSSLSISSTSTYLRTTCGETDNEVTRWTVGHLPEDSWTLDYLSYRLRRPTICDSSVDSDCSPFSTHTPFL